MSAIAWELPEDIRAVRDGLLDFARKEVLPRHQAHRDLFEDPRRLYREDGRFLRCAEGADRRGAARLGQGRLLQYVRARIAGRRRPGASCLLCRLGGAVPAVRAAELADALCHQPLGLRAEPASRKSNGRGARAHAGADDGGRGVDVLRPVRAGRRLRCGGAGDACPARRQRLAPHGPQDLDVQRAGRGLLHRLRDHRSRAGGPAPAAASAPSSCPPVRRASRSSA